ncbi:MAG: T9SS type A sorting domain-containing protein [Bacteroidales bacterium]|nr:T9SS type A sorting domain-containing protein [Bacteroidales bacterium]
MKKLYVFLPLLALPVLFILLANGSGSPGGRTGSIGDNGQNCTGCHTGTPQNASGWITTNVTGAGYIGGQTYTISLTGSHAGSNKFGFELTAEDLSGNKVGTFIITNSSQTKLANQNKAVTHTSAGTAGSGGSKSWSVDWTAPQGSTGAIKFYASVNATNSNGNTSGDVVYLTNLTINPDVTGVDEISERFSFYPNPTNGLVNFNLNDTEISGEISVYSVNGQQVYNFKPTDGLNQVDFSNLSKGVYLVKFHGDDRAEMKKLIIN